MSTPSTIVPGIIADGRQPVWAIQLADMTTPITSSTTSIPLSAVTGGQQLDCYYEIGGIDLNRTQTTRTRQRACQKIAEEIKTGETIAGSISPIFDQQQTDEADINAAYAALPEGSQVYLFAAHGWDAEQEATAETKGDLWRVRISQVDHPFRTVAGEDLVATVNLTGDLYIPNVTLTSP